MSINMRKVTEAILGPKSVKEAVKEFKKLKKPVFTVTLYDNQSIKNFGDELVKILKSK